MRHPISILLILVILTSCKRQNKLVEERLKTVDKFVQCLANNTPDKILDYTYPYIDDKISNKEFRDFYVNKAFEFIKKFGLPSKDKWIINYNLQNNSDIVITIPLFKGYDTTYNLLKADIVLTFPPPQMGDKIYKYEIADKYKPEPLDNAPLSDTIKSKK